MARWTTGTVIEAESPWEGAAGLGLVAPSLQSAAPGQYLLAGEAGRRDPLLLQPLLPALHDAALGIARMVWPVGGPIGWHVGANLVLLGPLGRPFTVERAVRRALLVGGGDGLGALLFLAHALVRQGREVTFARVSGVDEAPMPAAALPPEVEYQQAGNSGAFLAEHEALLAWADALYVALPMADLRGVVDALRRRLLRLRKGFAQALVVPDLLPCGVGACDLCTVATRSGMRRPCRDGLVFDLLDLA